MSDDLTSRTVIKAEVADARRYWEDDPSYGLLRKVVKERETNGKNALFEGIKIVDCDTHFTEPPDLFSRNVPAALKGKLPRVKRVGDQDRWFVGDTDFGTFGGNVISKDGDKLLGRMGFRTFDDIDPGSYSVQPRLAAMDAMGVWAQICFQNSGVTQVGSLLGLGDDNLALTILKICNDACAERMHESGNRIFCMASLPYWNKDAMLAETRRVIDMGVRGVVMPDRPERIGVPGFIGPDGKVAPFWDEFFDLCASTGTPLNFHLNTAMDVKAAVWDNLKFPQRIPITGMLTNMGCCATLANFVMSGLLDRYPKLKIGLIESGLGWVPYALEWLEYQGDEMNTFASAGLQRRPREYFKQFWVSYWFETFGPRTMLEEIGVDRIMFETDYPHPTSLYPNVQDKLVQTLGDRDYETRRRILERNAVELYRLPF